MVRKAQSISDSAGGDSLSIREPSFTNRVSKPCCQEKIYVFVDRCSEANELPLRLQDGTPLKGFDRLKKVVAMFVRNKDLVSCQPPDFQHEYALCYYLGDSPAMMYGPNSDAVGFVEELDTVTVIMRPPPPSPPPPPPPPHNKIHVESDVSIDSDVSDAINVSLRPGDTERESPSSQTGETQSTASDNPDTPTESETAKPDETAAAVGEKNEKETESEGQEKEKIFKKERVRVEEDELDLGKVLETVADSVSLPDGVHGDESVSIEEVHRPVSVVRLVLFICRSFSIPKFTISLKGQKMLAHPHFYLDFVYFHDYPRQSDDENNVEEIYSKLLENLRQPGKSYTFEVGPNVTYLHNTATQLLKHSQTRVPQPQQEDVCQKEKTPPTPTSSRTEMTEKPDTRLSTEMEASAPHP